VLLTKDKGSNAKMFRAHDTMCINIPDFMRQPLAKCVGDMRLYGVSLNASEIDARVAVRRETLMQLLGILEHWQDHVNAAGESIFETVQRENHERKEDAEQQNASQDSMPGHVLPNATEGATNTKRKRHESGATRAKQSSHWCKDPRSSQDAKSAKATTNTDNNKRINAPGTGDKQGVMKFAPFVTASGACMQQRAKGVEYLLGVDDDGNCSGKCVGVRLWFWNFDEKWNDAFGISQLMASVQESMQSRKNRRAAALVARNGAERIAQLTDCVSTNEVLNTALHTYIHDEQEIDDWFNPPVESDDILLKAKQDGDKERRRLEIEEAKAKGTPVPIRMPRVDVSEVHFPISAYQADRRDGNGAKYHPLSVTQRLNPAVGGDKVLTYNMYDPTDRPIPVWEPQTRMHSYFPVRQSTNYNFCDTMTQQPQEQQFCTFDGEKILRSPQLPAQPDGLRKHGLPDARDDYDYIVDPYTFVFSEEMLKKGNFHVLDSMTDDLIRAPMPPMPRSSRLPPPIITKMFLEYVAPGLVNGEWLSKLKNDDPNICESFLAYADGRRLPSEAAGHGSRRLEQYEREAGLSITKAVGGGAMRAATGHTEDTVDATKPLAEQPRQLLRARLERVLKIITISKEKKKKAIDAKYAEDTAKIERVFVDDAVHKSWRQDALDKKYKAVLRHSKSECHTARMAFDRWAISEVTDMMITSEDDLPPSFVSRVSAAWQFIDSHSQLFLRKNPEDGLINNAVREQSFFANMITTLTHFAVDTLRMVERPTIYLLAYFKNFEGLIPDAKWVFKIFGPQGCGKSFFINQFFEVGGKTGGWHLAGTSSTHSGKNGIAIESGGNLFFDEEMQMDDKRRDFMKQVVSGRQFCHSRTVEFTKTDGSRGHTDQRIITTHEEQIFLCSNRGWLGGMCNAQRLQEPNSNQLSWMERHMTVFWRKPLHPPSPEDKEYKQRMTQESTHMRTYERIRMLDALTVLALPYVTTIPTFDTDTRMFARYTKDLDEAAQWTRHGASRLARQSDASTMLLRSISAAHAVYYRAMHNPINWEMNEAGKLIAKDAVMDPLPMHSCELNIDALIHPIAPFTKVPTVEIQAFAWSLERYTGIGSAPVFDHIFFAFAELMRVDVNAPYKVPKPRDAFCSSSSSSSSSNSSGIVPTGVGGYVVAADNGKNADGPSGIQKYAAYWTHKPTTFASAFQAAGRALGSREKKEIERNMGCKNFGAVEKALTNALERKLRLMHVRNDDGCLKTNDGGGGELLSSMDERAALMPTPSQILTFYKQDAVYQALVAHNDAANSISAASIATAKTDYDDMASTVHFRPLTRDDRETQTADRMNDGDSATTPEPSSVPIALDFTKLVHTGIGTWTDLAKRLNNTLYLGPLRIQEEYLKEALVLVSVQQSIKGGTAPNAQVRHATANVPRTINPDHVNKIESLLADEPVHQSLRASWAISAGNAADVEKKRVEWAEWKREREKMAGCSYTQLAIDRTYREGGFPAMQQFGAVSASSWQKPFQIENVGAARAPAKPTKKPPDNDNLDDPIPSDATAEESGVVTGVTHRLLVDTQWLMRTCVEWQAYYRLFLKGWPGIDNHVDDDMTHTFLGTSELPAFWDGPFFARIARAIQDATWKHYITEGEEDRYPEFVTPIGSPLLATLPLTVPVTCRRRIDRQPKVVKARMKGAPWKKMQQQTHSIAVGKDTSAEEIQSSYRNQETYEDSERSHINPTYIQVIDIYEQNHLMQGKEDEELFKQFFDNNNEHDIDDDDFMDVTPPPKPLGIAPASDDQKGCDGATFDWDEIAYGELYRGAIRERTNRMLPERTWEVSTATPPVDYPGGRNAVEDSLNRDSMHCDPRQRQAGADASREAKNKARNKAVL
jgi:hypothetical protein